MRLLLIIFLPFAVFFTIGRPFSGIICLILQVTVIGWLPASLWALYATNNYNTAKKMDALRNELHRSANAVPPPSPDSVSPSVQSGVPHADCPSCGCGQQSQSGAPDSQPERG